MSKSQPIDSELQKEIKNILQNFAVCRDQISGDVNDNNSDFYCSMKLCFDGYNINKSPIDDLFDRAVNEILKVLSSPLVSDKLNIKKKK